MPPTDRETIEYRVPEDVGPDDIMAVLRGRFETATPEDEVRRVTYFDTFDARLRRSGMVLARGAGGSNGRLSLTSHLGHPIARCDASGQPGFAGELPVGSLRDAIAPKTTLRRLLPLVDIEKAISTVRILDDEGKTVAHVRLEQGAARPPRSRTSGRELPTVLRVVPVKGYGRARDRVVAALERELRLERHETDELATAMEACGRSLGDPSKLDLHLDPACPAETAMRQIHAALLEVVLHNEPGTRKQLDTEFLHDFRVTVRRIRSALGQVKGVFPEKERARFSAEFAWLAGATGPARDADVFLLKLPRYRAQLPEHTRADLQALEDFLEVRRDNAYRNLVKVLNSKRYARLIEQWTAFIASPAPDCDTAPLANEPIGDVASARIWTVAKGVLKKGDAIDDDTPAAPVHRLRIRCKKLRYLLDLFRSLHDPKEIKRLIRSLKKLQDNLGDFNDCEVQQGWLTETAREMAAGGSTPVETLLAMGRLEDKLEIRQHEERQRFGRRYAAFSKQENRDRMRRLFGPGNRQDT